MLESSNLFAPRMLRLWSSVVRPWVFADSWRWSLYKELWLKRFKPGDLRFHLAVLSHVENVRAKLNYSCPPCARRIWAIKEVPLSTTYISDNCPYIYLFPTRMGRYSVPRLRWMLHRCTIGYPILLCTQLKRSFDGLLSLAYISNPNSTLNLINENVHRGH